MWFVYTLLGNPYISPISYWCSFSPLYQPKSRQVEKIQNGAQLENKWLLDELKLETLFQSNIHSF